MSRAEETRLLNPPEVLINRECMLKPMSSWHWFFIWNNVKRKTTKTIFGTGYTDADSYMYSVYGKDYFCQTILNT